MPSCTTDPLPQAATPDQVRGLRGPRRLSAWAPSPSDPEPFAIRHTGPRALQLWGEVDLATAPGLLRSLRFIAAAGDVECDLTNVTFMSAAGINALVTVYREQAALGRALRITCASPLIDRVFVILGLRSLLVSAQSCS